MGQQYLHYWVISSLHLEAQFCKFEYEPAWKIMDEMLPKPEPGIKMLASFFRRCFETSSIIGL